MTVTISRLYDDYATASRVVNDLESAGVPHADISIVASNADNWYSPTATGRTTTGAATAKTTGRVDRDHDGVDDRAEGAATGAGIGAVVGSGAGLLTGLGLMAIPGVGPVVAAGWLVATAVGALAGGATGGVIGALTQTGVSDEDAQVYAEGVRRGGSLVTVRVPDADRARVQRCSIAQRLTSSLVVRHTVKADGGALMRRRRPSQAIRFAGNGSFIIARDVFRRFRGRLR